MNHFSKVALNFLVCWSLLFTQAAWSVEDTTPSPEAGSFFSNITTGVYDWFNKRIYGDDNADSITVESGSRGSRRELRRSGYNSAPVNLGIDPALGRISNSCSSVNTLELSIPGIESLADHFSESSCSSEAFQSLATVGSENGEANSVNLCKNLEALKDSGACVSSPMPAVSLPLEIREWRNDPEMRELEVELKAKTLEKEWGELAKIAELQATLASDMELMNYFYKSLQSETDPQIRENYKAQYGLEDSFFNSGNDMPLSQFVNKVFSCLPGGQGLAKLDLKNNMCEGSDSLLPGEDTGSSVLDEARTRFATNCMANEECSLNGYIDAEGNDLSKTLSISVGDSIAANAGEGQGHMGNIAAIDSNLGMDHLPEAIKMMDFFNNDTSDRNGNPKVFEIVGRALNRHNRTNSRHGDDSLQLARKTALNYTLNLIREESDFLEDEASLAYFNGIIESSTKNDLLDFEGYDVGQIMPLIERYQTENPELEFYPEGFTEEEKIEKNRALVALIQRAAVGQRMGDYIVENRRSLRAQAIVLGGTQTSDKINAISTSLNNTLNGGRSGTLSSQEVGSVLNNLEGGQKLGVLWKSAANFESIFSSYGSPLNIAHGARNLAKVLERTNENLSREEILKAHPDLANLSHEDFMFMRMKLVKNQAFALVAQRSAMACNEKIKPVYMKHKLCSPLSEPEYSNKALEKLLGTSGLNRQAGDILNSASVLCTSILNEDFERRVEAQNYDTLSPNIGEIRQQRCNEKSNSLFCGEVCTGDQIRGVTNNQVLLFGFVCQPGHQTVENSQVMASVDSNGRTTFPNFAGITNIENTSADDVLKTDNLRAPVATAGSFDSGLRATTSLKNRGSKFPSRRSLVAGPGGNAISSGQKVTSIIPSANAKVSNSFETSKGEVAGGFSSSPTTVFPNQIRANTGEKESLAQELQGQESTLDPASQVLLKRLEEMERRQANLQRELEESRKSLGEEEDEGRAKLVAELNKLKSEIPLLEDKLREKQDVRRALAEAKPEVRNSAPVPTPVRRSAFGGGSNVGRSIASVAPTSNGPSSAPVDNSSDDGGGGSSPSGVRNFTRGGGAEISSLTTSGSGRGDGLLTTDSVVTLTQEIRDRAVIVAPGVSPEDAVLQARGPILIPIGEEGEFIMYEPELTVDGEVKTEDGQVVFKTVVKVSDLLARDRFARLPASIEEAPLEELPEGYDPRRLFQLDGLLDNVVPVSN